MIEQLCKDLKTTYDTNILDNESDVVQKEFRDVSLENTNITTNNGRKVLMKLICNHYDEMIQKPTAEFIGGPKTLTVHWHPGYKKMIYIFGEWRNTNSTDCEKFKEDSKQDINTILIEDYLYNLMLTTDAFLDIYFEFISYKEGENEYEPPGHRSHKIFNKFRKCLYYNTQSNLDCQLARVHYFDIRLNDVKEDDIEEDKINIFWFIETIRYLIINKGKHAAFDLKILLKKYKKISTLLKELVQDDMKKVCEFMKKQLTEENPYIKKELDKINNQELKTFILTFYDKLICKEVSRIIPTIKNHILIILNYDKQLDDALLNSMNFTKLYFMNINSYFVDVYLLARVFKDFDMSEMGSSDQPISAHNIIIHCNNSHANNYRDFLLSIGFNDVDHTGDLREDRLEKTPNTPKNCLDMRRIKQPFFSYLPEEKELNQFNRISIPTPKTPVKTPTLPRRTLTRRRVPTPTPTPTRVPSPTPSPIRIPSPEKHPYIIIQQRCCNRPTQFPSRMARCEGRGHTFAAGLSYFGSFLSNQDSNLDGIVELRNATILKNEPTFKEVEYLDTKPYISDHNGIVLHLSTQNKPMDFNIISCNLEGLCRQTKDDSRYRIKSIKDHFRDVIKKGSILVFQEIVLQKLANSELNMTDEDDDEESVVVKKHKWVDVVGEDILSELESINDNLLFMSDTYTGGVFYDSSVWELTKTIDISRLYNGSLSSKFSNAYLFNCINTKCLFWVVNIHLKAFPPGTTEHSLDLLNSNENVNKAHIIELEHIISQLIIESNYFRIPIYLCGDYNNNSPKDILVEKAIKKSMKSLDHTEYTIGISTIADGPWIDQPTNKMNTYFSATN
jgi:hypothetical protein